ncbi:hypothetical protein [Sporomusa acidovorans]|uniref:Uncharacterized protein n=1 Tax=Sporomusa acidovorans (strain ATCC 49682 / DSM 3132 / Mol) TaxID=1123286 RepID=A0ABZ3J1T6_SPOA4|nr:hypothetical protein [Sporomusa acidovorans]OZC13629.1 hypothetical protein SPACI_56100 [Sporomusa acidovorans DSM 3132]SDE86474.1 hypothetical protein SAMN04488499_102442 [Sporomusa acidovorans]
MSRLAKIFLLVCTLLAVIGFTVTAAANELIKVTVTVKVEKPEYFWQYPFLGKQLDHITFSSYGKTYTLSPLSESETLEIDVPKDYHLRMNISFQNNASTLQSISYLSKEAIHQPGKHFSLLLKAPEPQPVSVSSPDFEVVRN